MILVTGGAGYIGSHCVLALLKSGFDVVVFDNLSTGHQKTVDSLKKTDYKGRFAEFIKGDLQDFESINSVFKKYKIDAAMHFAAYSQAGESVVNPQKYYRNNVLGSLNLLNAMVSNSVLKIVFSSTAAVYGETRYVPIDENHPKEPVNPYGHTKFIIENMLKDYDFAYGLKSISLRYFNAAGADENLLVGENHDPETHLIPNILKSALGSGKSFSIFGDDYETKDGTCIRDYVNVEDLAEAHLRAFEYLSSHNQSDCFNLGTGGGKSVKEIFSACEKVVGEKINVEIKPRRSGDCPVLIADSKKAASLLGWQPKRTLEDSVKTAFLWEKSLMVKV